MFVNSKNITETPKKKKYIQARWKQTTRPCS